MNRINPVLLTRRPEDQLRREFTLPPQHAQGRGKHRMPRVVFFPALILVAVAVSVVFVLVVAALVVPVEWRMFAGFVFGVLIGSAVQGLWWMRGQR